MNEKQGVVSSISSIDGTLKTIQNQNKTATFLRQPFFHKMGHWTNAIPSSTKGSSSCRPTIVQ